MVLVKMLAALALLAAPAMVAAQSPAIDAALAAMEDYDDAGALAALNEGCDAGDTAACRMLLAMLSTNYDENDDATARALASKMCESGEMLGCVTLARFAEVGRGGDADHELQRNSIFTACRAGHAGACLQATYLAQQDNDGMGDEALGREMAQFKPDFIQINYSLGEREAEDRLLPMAQDQGVAVLINRPFQAGRLFAAVSGTALPDWAQDFAASWGQFFLKFIISHPAVTCVIPATSKVHHMVDNLATGQGILPDPAMRKRMSDFFASL